LTRLRGQTSGPAQRPSSTSNSGVTFCFTAPRLGQLRLGCKKHSREEAAASTRNAEPIETQRCPDEPGDRGANSRKRTRTRDFVPQSQRHVPWLVPRMYHACTSHVPGSHLPIPSQSPPNHMARTWLVHRMNLALGGLAPTFSILHSAFCLPLGVALTGGDERFGNWTPHSRVNCHYPSVVIPIDVLVRSGLNLA
jgi:hypothetical protein